MVLVTTPVEERVSLVWIRPVARGAAAEIWCWVMRKRCMIRSVFITQTRTRQRQTDAASSLPERVAGDQPTQWSRGQIQTARAS